MAHQHKRKFLKNIVTILFYFFYFFSPLISQNIVTARLGPSFAFQKWNGSTNNIPLFASHGAIGLESLKTSGPYTFYSEIGYHLRGSGERVQGFTSTTGLYFNPFTIKNKFHNVFLAVGGKKFVGIEERYYFKLGLRLDYTLKSELYYYYQGFKSSIRKLNYGMDIGGGWEFPIGFAHIMFLEAGINPDASKQIYSPPSFYVDRETGLDRNFPEQKVLNFSIYLTIGIKLNGNPLLYEDAVN